MAPFGSLAWKICANLIWQQGKEASKNFCNEHATIKFTGLIGIDSKIKKFSPSRSRFVTFELNLASNKTYEINLEKFGQLEIGVLSDIDQAYVKPDE